MAQPSTKPSPQCPDSPVDGPFPKAQTPGRVRKDTSAAPSTCGHTPTVDPQAQLFATWHKQVLADLAAADPPFCWLEDGAAPSQQVRLTPQDN